MAGEALHRTLNDAHPNEVLTDLHLAFSCDGSDWRLVYDRLSGGQRGLGVSQLKQAVHEIAGEKVRSVHIESIVSRYDRNGDGTLCYDEFETMLKQMLKVPHDKVMLRSSPVPQPERYTTKSIWLSSLRNFHGSQVLRGIFNPLMCISITSLFVALLHASTGLLPAGRASKSLVQMHSLLGGALSLLLVFRTNSAYNRFWEARRIWESVLNRCRDLARFTYLYKADAGEPRANFVSALLCAFPRELRAHLVGNSIDEDERARDERLSSPTKWSLSHPSSRDPARRALRLALRLDRRSHRGEEHAEWAEETRASESTGPAESDSAARGGSRAAIASSRATVTMQGKSSAMSTISRIAPPLPAKISERIATAGNKPLYVCKWLASEVKNIPESLTFTSRERMAAIAQVNQLSSYVGACERLLQTPVPLNYARHTSRFLTLWCLTLPISLVETMGLLVVPVTAFVTWCLFGIQEIGLFIEHCALDDGSIFMDTITELVALDVMEALEEEEPLDDIELADLTLTTTANMEVESTTPTMRDVVAAQQRAMQFEP